jgi:ABC-type branched-subunit amino acid transport system permease subunit
VIEALVWGFILAVMLGLTAFVPTTPQRLSLGGAGFMALGAMIAGSAAGYVQGSIVTQILIGALSAAGAGVLVGFGFRRLDDRNFALATLAFSAIMVLIASTDRRMQVDILHKVFPLHVSAVEGLFVLALCLWICRAAAGNWFAYGAGALAAGVVGVLIPAEVAHGTTALIEQLCMAVGVAVIGGRRSIFGPAVGAPIAACALPLIHIAGRGGPIIAGLLLIGAYIWLPDGLLGIASRVSGSIKERRADGAA